MKDAAGRERSMSLAHRLWFAASIGALAVAAPVAASAQATGTVTNLEEVMVTASRVQTTGFTAPTPTSALSTEAIERQAAVRVSEILAQVPSFRATVSGNGTYANLRAIGAARTLVLVDGRRHVPTFPDGTMDLNVIPSSLVKRSEIVTGGASASWGSDAVAGVINLLLKTDLKGFEATVQVGTSERGDNASVTAGLAAGTGFAGDRGRAVIGLDFTDAKEVRSSTAPYNTRDFGGRQRISNPSFATNGLPGIVYADNVRPANFSPGGLITSGPLRGTKFDAAGNPVAFQFGQVIGISMIGGDPENYQLATQQSDLAPPLQRFNALAHAEFDFTPDFTGYVEGSFASSIVKSRLNIGINQGATANPTCATTVLASATGGINVNINNAFLPATVRQQLQAAGATCFSLGKAFMGTGQGAFLTNDGSPAVWRGVAGFRAGLPGDWKVDGYVQHGHAEYRQRRGGNIVVANLNNAIDAVVGPNGQIACRINTDASTTNDDAACAPYNLFGADRASAAAVAYVTRTSKWDIDLYQTVAALNLNGELFHTWAGPIGAAFGAEYRKEKGVAVADPIAQANGYQTSNRKSQNGEYNVKEAYGELIVPLARNKPLMQAIDLNLAARYTDYSSSGGVETWKAGLSWALNDDVRLRLTRSRDVRAGNIGELFAAEARTAAIVVDPRTATSLNSPIITTGNPTLKPEEADTLTAGVVYRPSWLPRFQASIDYYDIDIKGVIGAIAPQLVLDRCFISKDPTFCADVALSPSGTIVGVTSKFQNLDSFKTSGVDIELAYSLPAATLWDSAEGDFQFHLYASYVDKLALTAGASKTVSDPAGQYTNPNWTVFGTATYRAKRWSLTVEERYFGGGTVDNTKQLGVLSANGINVNDVDAIWYTHLAFTYDLGKRFGADTEVFGRVINLFDELPPFPSNPGTVIDQSNVGAAATTFDPIGRGYRLGVRVKY